MLFTLNAKRSVLGAAASADGATMDLDAIGARSWTLAFNPAATDTTDGSTQPAIGMPAFCPDDASDGLAKRYYFVKLTEVRPVSSLDPSISLADGFCSHAAVR